MKTFGFMFWLSLTLGSLSAAPSVLIRSEAAPKEIYIGDLIRYHITVAFSSPVAAMPLKVEKKIGEFELLDLTSSAPTEEKNGKISITHSLVLTTFSTGTYSIPGISLTFAMGDGKVSEAVTEAIPVKVKSLLEEKGDEGHLRPLKGLFNFRSYRWLWILLCTLLGLIILYFGFEVWRRKTGLLQKPAPPPRPAEEVALEALAALEKDDLIVQKQIKEFYFRLSVICREYLDNRYGMSAIEKTTSELVAEFRKRNLTLDSTTLMRQLLDNADLVKFARFDPPEKDITADVMRARRFIEITTPQPVPAAEKDAIPV